MFYSRQMNEIASQFIHDDKGREFIRKTIIDHRPKRRDGQSTAKTTPILGCPYNPETKKYHLPQTDDAQYYPRGVNGTVARNGKQNFRMALHGVPITTTILQDREDNGGSDDYDDTVNTEEKDPSARTVLTEDDLNYEDPRDCAEIVHKLQAGLDRWRYWYIVEPCMQQLDVIYFLISRRSFVQHILAEQDSKRFGGPNNVEPVLICPVTMNTGLGIPCQFRETHQLPEGIVRTSFLSGAQNFVMFFHGVLISDWRFDVDARLVNYEDPRDCAQILQALQRELEACMPMQ